MNVMNLVLRCLLGVNSLYSYMYSIAYFFPKVKENTLIVTKNNKKVVNFPRLNNFLRNLRVVMHYKN